MKARGLQTEYVASPLDSVGNHPALNFINTLHMEGSELSDTWQSDEDVAVMDRSRGIAGYSTIHNMAKRRFASKGAP